MKEEIDKIIDLAKQYVYFATVVGLPMTHNNIRGGHQSIPSFWTEGDLINIYLSQDYKVWSVTFKDVEIVGYNKKISLPFDCTAEYLTERIEDAEKHLQYLLEKLIMQKLKLI